MEVPFKAIKEKLEDIGTFFSTLIDFINPFSENFILRQLWNFLTNIISYINPFDDNFLGNKIIDLLNNLLKFLFIPTNNPFDKLSSKFNEKFAFVQQIKTFANNLFNNTDFGDNLPSFNITFYGITFSLIDFSIFLSYRSLIHGIILAISWVIFIFKTYKKLPSIIGGFN